MTCFVLPHSSIRKTFAWKTRLTAVAACAAMTSPAFASDLLRSNGFEIDVCPPAYPNEQIAVWSDHFFTWPGFGVTQRIYAPFNGYISFSFVATQITTQFGSVTTADFPGDGDGVGQMSISRSPGCFDQAYLGENCLSPPGRFASIGWMNRTGPYACNLTPGDTYYVNITYGGPEAATGPQCPSGKCGADVIQYPQD